MTTVIASRAIGHHAQEVCAREALNKTGVVSWYETTGEL